MELHIGDERPMYEFNINMQELFNQKVIFDFKQPPKCGSHGGQVDWLHKEVYRTMKKLMWNRLEEIGFQWEEFINFVDETEKGRGVWSFIGRSGFCKGKIYIAKSRLHMNTIENFTLELKMFEGKIYENMEK